jgi:hypothetical protein
MGRSFCAPGKRPARRASACRARVSACSARGRASRGSIRLETRCCRAHGLAAITASWVASRCSPATRTGQWLPGWPTRMVPPRARRNCRPGSPTTHQASAAMAAATADSEDVPPPPQPGDVVDQHAVAAEDRGRRMAGKARSRQGAARPGALPRKYRKGESALGCVMLT